MEFSGSPSQHQLGAILQLKEISLKILLEETGSKNFSSKEIYSF